jgi:hypothetical protein
MSKPKSKPPIHLDPKLFWDVEYSEASLINYPEFVIERVIQRGSVKDFGKIIKYFGKPKIREYLITKDNFSPIQKSFVKSYFNLTNQDLRSQRPSFPKLW